MPTCIKYLLLVVTGLKQEIEISENYGIVLKISAGWQDFFHQGSRGSLDEDVFLSQQ